MLPEFAALARHRADLAMAALTPALPQHSCRRQTPARFLHEAARQ
ncbi:hypothetical protein [Pseudofulvimonas gallinarii]